jgi:hypothetical protein
MDLMRGKQKMLCGEGSFTGSSQGDRMERKENKGRTYG